MLWGVDGADIGAAADAVAAAAVAGRTAVATPRGDCGTFCIFRLPISRCAKTKSAAMASSEMLSGSGRPRAWKRAPTWTGAAAGAAAVCTCMYPADAVLSDRWSSSTRVEALLPAVPAPRAPPAAVPAVVPATAIAIASLPNAGTPSATSFDPVCAPEVTGGVTG